MSDVFTVLFDDRPAFAWAPPEDDPWGWQPAVNGTYSFNFSGSGGVFPGSDPGMKGGMSVTNVTFDAATFTTAGLITIQAGSPALAELIINGTRRSASAPLGSGFTNLVVMRPGHGGCPLPVAVDASNNRNRSPPPTHTYTHSHHNHTRPTHPTPHPPHPPPAADADMTLSPELVAALTPFAHFRFMGITGTNTNPGYYGDAGHHCA